MRAYAPESLAKRIVFACVCARAPDPRWRAFACLRALLLRVARQTCLFVCARKPPPTARRAGAAELAGRGGGGHVDPGPGLRRGPLLARPPHARPPRRPPLRPRPRAAQGERCRRLCYHQNLPGRTLIAQTRHRHNRIPFRSEGRARRVSVHSSHLHISIIVRTLREVSVRKYFPRSSSAIDRRPISALSFLRRRNVECPARCSTIAHTHTHTHTHTNTHTHTPTHKRPAVQ